MNEQELEVLRDIKDRQIRMETRLVQLMLHMGLDPNVRQYDRPRTVLSDIRFGETGSVVPVGTPYGH
jgi:hypothetical protein